MGSMVQSMFVLGNAYFLNPTVPNTPPIGTNSMNSTVNRTANEISFEAEPSRNDACKDYKNVPGIGTHKVHTQAAPWNTCRKICMEEGGYLAVINSDAEAKHISELARNCEPQTGSNFPTHFHIGIHNIYDDDEWVTLQSESLVTAGFSNWHAGEPNRDGKACGSISYRDNELYDSSFETPLGFICEKS